MNFLTQKAQEAGGGGFLTGGKFKHGALGLKKRDLPEYSKFLLESLASKFDAESSFILILMI